jgi:hypothetical protein
MQGFAGTARGLSKKCSDILRLGAELPPEERKIPLLPPVYDAMPKSL